MDSSTDYQRKSGNEFRSPLCFTFAANPVSLGRPRKRARRAKKLPGSVLPIGK
jgi:hypothetical protein